MLNLLKNIQQKYLSYNFEKKIYPYFFENIEKAKKNEMSVIFVEMDDSILSIFIVIGLKALIIRKHKEMPLMMRNVVFGKNIINFDHEIYELVIKSKNGMLINKNSLIESLSNIFNKTRVPYQLSLEQQKNIWYEIFNLDTDFFSSGEVKVQINTSHTWMD